jgi:hypothetical protein
VGIEQVQVCTRRNLCRVQGEEYQRKILIELLNTLSNSSASVHREDAGNASENLKENQVQEEDMCKDCTRPTLIQVLQEFI